MAKCMLHEKLQEDVTAMNTTQMEHTKEITILKTRFSDIGGTIKLFGTILAILSGMVELTLIVSKFIH